MNGLRSKTQQPSDRSSLDALNRTIEGLEARIEGLMSQKFPREPRASQAPEPKAEAYAAPRAARAPRASVTPPQLDPVNEIRQRQRLLETSFQRPQEPVARPERTITRPLAPEYQPNAQSAATAPAPRARSIPPYQEQQRNDAAVHDLAQWRDWTDDNGTVHTYADRIDGKTDFWKRRDLTGRVYAAVFNAYQVPAALGGVLAEYLDWQSLERERGLFCGGEWNHHREVEARIAVLKDELDNRPAATCEDMDARIGWWEESLSWDFTPSLEEERLRKQRIAADLQFLHGCDRPAGVHVGQTECSTDREIRHQSRSNADIRNAVLSMLDTSPELSDREISRRVGVSPQTVNNWRHRQEAFEPRKRA